MRAISHFVCSGSVLLWRSSATPRCNCRADPYAQRARRRPCIPPPPVPRPRYPRSQKSQSNLFARLHRTGIIHQVFRQLPHSWVCHIFCLLFLYRRLFCINSFVTSILYFTYPLKKYKSFNFQNRFGKFRKDFCEQSKKEGRFFQKADLLPGNWHNMTRRFTIII